MSWRDQEAEPLDLRGQRAGADAESVSAFTRRLKALLESGLSVGWVRGEVSNLRRQASGHVYFSLKDAGAQLNCVLFRGDAMRQTVALRDGLQVVANGRVSVYEARGQYQLVVRSLVEDGVGRLQQAFEALKQRLAAEGLFERERKRPLPPLPLRVGFVTSPTGAAVQDFARIMVRRGWRGRLVVLPAKVQGAGAAEEIAARIEQAARLACFDVLVVGRGGGSLEDLWAFNEEVVVRAVAACPVPVISAVGHEIDFTLSDFAADVRAETPSGAAELLSSAYATQTDRLSVAGDELEVQVRNRLEEARERIGHLQARLRLLTPRAQIEQGWLRRDDLANRLAAALTQSQRDKRHALQSVARAFRAADPQRRVEQESHRLLGLWKRLQAVSADSVLQRGFAILRDEQGQAVTQADAVKAGAAYEVQLADGRAKLRGE